MANDYRHKVVYGGETLIDLTSDDIEGSKVIIGTTFHLPDGHQVTAVASPTGDDEVAGIPTLAASVTYPSTQDQIISSGQYLSGSQTIKAVTTQNINAADIKVGTQIRVGDADHPGAIADITGTFTSDADAQAAEILSSKTAYVNGSKVTGTMINNGAVSGTVTGLSSAGDYVIPQGYHDGSGRVSLSSADQSKIIPENIRENITILGVTGTMSGSEGAKPTALVATAYTTQKNYQPSDFGDYNYFSDVTVSAIAYSTAPNPAGGTTVTIGTVAPA